MTLTGFGFSALSRKLLFSAVRLRLEFALRLFLSARYLVLQSAAGDLQFAADHCRAAESRLGGRDRERQNQKFALES